MFDEFSGSTPRRSAGIRALIPLLLLLALTRAALVLSLADVFFYGEELGKGTAAKAMLDDLGVEHWKLNYVHHEGGGFVVTHLKALAFLLVGENLLAHKLVALTTSALTLAAGFLLVARHFGTRAAFVFGMLFVLAPAAFLRFSLLSLGTHFEALLFLALVVHFTLKITESSSARPRDFLLLGLAAGFGLYFSLQAVPALAASGLFPLVRARDKLTLRNLSLALVAFVVGVAPWIYTISKAGMDAIRVRGSEIAGKSGTSALDSLAFLFEPLQSQVDPFDWAALLLYPVVIGLGFARLSPELVATRRRAALVALLLAIFFAAYVGSGLAIPSGGHWFFFLRLSTFWFFANVLFAAAVGNLLARRAIAPRAIAIAATVVLVVAGVDDLLALVRTGSPAAMADNVRTLATQKGYDYTQYFDKFKTHLEGGEAEKIAVLKRFDDDPELLLPAISHSLFERSPLALEEVLSVARTSFGSSWTTGLHGLGTYLAPDGRYDVEGAFAGIESAPEETRAALAEAIGRTGYGLRITSERLEREIAAEVDPALRPAFLHGTGARLHAFHLLRPERAIERIEREAEPVRGWLRAGFDAAVRANTLR